MSLANLLSAEQIIPEMKATERWAAIVELIDLLVSLGKIKPADRDPILAALKQREETMSTGIGFGIAIPHCSSDRLDEVVAAFGRSTKGIEFDALDNAPVKFVVLFIVPKNQFQTHLRTLASIAKFLNDRASAINSPTPDRRTRSFQFSARAPRRRRKCCNCSFTVAHGEAEVDRPLRGRCSSSCPPNPSGPN